MLEGQDQLSIIYLVGAGRSGTTLLSRLLELQDGFRAVGEPRYLGDASSWPLSCGCGQPHETCEVWGPLIARWADPERLRAWEAANRSRQLAQLSGFIAPSKPLPEVRHGLEEVRRVYSALAAGGATLVDESKTPWLGFLLAQQSWADVRFVELVRHPSEVLGAKARVKEYQPETPREVAAKHWLRTCVTANAIRMRTGRPWFRTSYQRLANEPGQVLNDILLHRPQGMDGAAFTAGENHIYLSNADKLRRGADAVRPISSPTPAPEPDAGRWEKMCLQYWNRWLEGRTELRRGWDES